MMDSQNVLHIVNPMQRYNEADLLLSPFREMCKLFRRVGSSFDFLPLIHSPLASHVFLAC